MPAAHVEVIGAPAATWPAMLCCKCCKSEEEKVLAPSSANLSRSSEQPGMLFITDMGTRRASIRGRCIAILSPSLSMEIATNG